MPDGWARSGKATAFAYDTAGAADLNDLHVTVRGGKIREPGVARVPLGLETALFHPPEGILSWINFRRQKKKSVVFYSS